MIVLVPVYFLAYVETKKNVLVHWSNLWSCLEERAYHTMVKRERDDMRFFVCPR